ncbi:L,D-transpeptidase family protein [Chenggangzhangella methanolivorans]|uniref:L,D-transpeptidase n=1 Tax=Chenggangzhangella methanolivorans TaxID=1437009 RepID=A0A9E6UKE5_9HYPH|nr:L,D-transpeptidase [Chenggangzhangella methanolivorans]QZN99206.1 L,D-transpeptidase [Chenggangzhangella methanolivorans]
MTFLARFVLVAALLAPVAAYGAPPPPPPPPSEADIDAARFEDWRARMDAQAAEDDRLAKALETAEGRSRAARKARAEALKQKAETEKARRNAPPDAFLIRVQILLDRAHASPGVIDGRDGDNLKKAVRAFRIMRAMPIEGGIDEPFWRALSVDQGKATRVYELTREDVGGRYVGKPLPKDYAKLAKMKEIGFRDAAEMLAERFHMDERFLKAMNPGADFGAAGARLLVAETGAPTGRAARIVVDKKEGELRAYDDTGKILIAAPATIGSPDTPSPSGAMKVTKAFPNPHYIYDPKKNFQQGKNRRRLVLPPGPNGPVGSMWIDLTKPTYGIHGTPEPSEISKTSSHGCVRLTNWDAAELGAIIAPNKTTVTFE